MANLPKVKAGDLLSPDKWNELVDKTNKIALQIPTKVGKNVGIGTAKPDRPLHVYSKIAKGGPTPLKVETNWGHMLMGARNDGWAHFYTTMPKYYFDKEVRVDSGRIGSYKADLKLSVAGKPKITVAKGNGTIVFNDPKVSLRIPNSGEVRIGPWVLRQSGGGDKKSYFHIDRWSGKKHQPNRFTVDWSGNIKAKNLAFGSDQRTKKDVKPFRDGLALIQKMNPVTFKFNGLGSTIDNAKGMGFLAQDLEKIAPYLVAKYKGKLAPNDQRETELLNVLPINIVYLLVNAVKELAQKLEAVNDHNSRKKYLKTQNLKIS